MLQPKTIKGDNYMMYKMLLQVVFRAYIKNLKMALG
jgi:hypothetical protein